MRSRSGLRAACTSFIAFGREPSHSPSEQLEEGSSTPQPAPIGDPIIVRLRTECLSPLSRATARPQIALDPVGRAQHAGHNGARSAPPVT